MKNISSKKFKEREQWFLDRIGKRVYRNKSTCKCSVCKRVYENGLIINDEMHADYLHCCENNLTVEETKMKYFDTLEEVKEFEDELDGIANDNFFKE